jgi:uncharacterized protein YndB with AHSA1/START domain
MSEALSAADELVYTRVFQAPRELVFRCMTEPEHLTHFWGPTGMSTPLSGIKIDARPGGVFETVMVNDADGSSYRMQAVYSEVDPPERLVWTDATSGVTTSSTFVDLGGSLTEVTIRQTNVPEEYRSPQVRAGFATALDQCARYLLTLSSR